MTAGAVQGTAPPAAGNGGDLLRRSFPDEVSEALDRYPPGREASAVLSLIYLAQAAYGWMTDEAIAEVSEVTGLPRTHVRGLVGFYTLLHERSHGGYVIHFCTDLPCALRDADELLVVLSDMLGIQPGETTDDGLFSLETAMCLAACDRAPMMQVNLEYFQDLTVQRLEEIIADLRARAAEGPDRRPPFGFGPPSDMAPAGRDDGAAESAPEGSFGADDGSDAPSPREGDRA